MQIDGTETFISHLIELRDRLLKAVVAWIILFVCLFPFANDLYSVLAQPLLDKLPKGGQMIATEVVTPFFVPIKVAMMTAFLGALPVILYQVWAFIAPGLYSHERKMIVPMVFASLVLFACGMAFAYFLVFPVVFGFIVGIAPVGVAVMTDIGKYLDFVITMFLAFGHHLRSAHRCRRRWRMTGMVEIEQIQGSTPVRGRRRLRHRRHLHATRCGLADHAGGAAVAALRDWRHRCRLVAQAQAGGPGGRRNLYADSGE
jgi:Tat protein translocase TatC